jgi:hypothetical protein
MKFVIVEKEINTKKVLERILIFFNVSPVQSSLYMKFKTNFINRYMAQEYVSPWRHATLIWNADLNSEYLKNTTKIISCSYAVYLRRTNLCSRICVPATKQLIITKNKSHRGMRTLKACIWKYVCSELEHEINHSLISCLGKSTER